MHRPETLYLIDGYAAIFRAYYAIRRPLYSPAGEETQAVYVFAQMLLKLYTTLQPDYIAVALDAPGRTFREDLYALYPSAAPSVQEEIAAAEAEVGEAPGEGEEPAGPLTGVAAGYKGTRQATPNSLTQQIPRILELLELCGIPTIGRPGLEADDVIATLTDRVLQDPAHPDLRVRIVSKDKDLEQLLGERTTLYDVHTGEELDRDALLAKRGVTPEQIVDLLTLTGDAVDNVPGVPGIGGRTAAKLLQRYGSLDGILENLDEITPRLRDNLETARPSLPVSRRLVTLERDPEIPFDLEQARVRPLPGEGLAQLCDTLGFHRIKESFLRLAEASITTEEV